AHDQAEGDREKAIIPRVLWPCATSAVWFISGLLSRLV
ncbi:MAG: hypothetical protein AVDCRST_MAG55-2224, partial [uncultured Rubrobacteraceae bacterium]